MKRTSSFSLVFSVAVLLTLGVNKSYATIIDSVTENINTARRIEYSKAKGGAACNKLESFTSAVGDRRQAFLHWVERCGERSELAMKTTKIGKTYWYGWSMFIPPDWQDASEGYDIVSQWAAYPTTKVFSKACGAVGSYMVIGKNTLSFHLQHKGDTAEVECNRFSLAKVSEIRGKWVDFVMEVKWTGNKDGFVKLWMKSGDQSYAQKVDYSGPTYWNDEDDGPYLKMGLYKGNPNYEGPAPRYLYTAEYRLGNANSSFEEVAPLPASQFCQYVPWLSWFFGVKCSN